MRYCIHGAAVRAAFIAFAFSMAASAELKSVGSSEIDLYLPGGTAGHKVYGKSDKLVVSESGGAITVAAHLDCILQDGSHTSCVQTGIALRDKQLWKYLESGKFPTATLSVERNRLRVPRDNEQVETDASGIFAVHGVTRQLNFHYEAARTGKYVQVRGKVVLNLNDFNIERPTFFGVHTGMLAEITVRFTLLDSP